MALDPNPYRPNLKCQLIFAGTMLAAIVSGYFLFTLIMASDEPNTESPKQVSERVSKGQTQTLNPKTEIKPWYQKQPPPPSLITEPDLPLFPEVMDAPSPSAEKPRAYEEALPRGAYDPPVTLQLKPGHLKPPTQQEAATVIEVPEPPEPKKQPAIVPEKVEQAALQTATARAKPLASPVPIPQTTEITAVIDGLPRWRYFAVQGQMSSGEEPLIAIVIDDMGVDKKHSSQAMDLQGPLTLSFLTYATDLEHQTERARAKGHELMLHVSMEPGSSTVDPGPNALLTELSNEELHRRLNWGLDRFSTYVGINNHMGSKFTSDSESMKVVLAELKRRGLLFLDSRTSGKTVGAKLAREMGVPVAERNIFLDHENSIEAVNKQLLQVEKMARRKGLAIAIGHPREATIKALKPWLQEIEAKGFRLVPLSTVVSLTGGT